MVYLRAGLALLGCLQACATSASSDAVGTDRSMWLELRAYRVSAAAYARLVAPRSTRRAELLPRKTLAGAFLPAPSGVIEPPRLTPSGLRLGVTIVDVDATPQLHILRAGSEASSLARDLDALDPSDLHRRAVGRVELMPSKGCGTRLEQQFEYTEDFEVQLVGSHSVTLRPITAELREQVDLRCVFDRRDDGVLDFEFELADRAIRRPIETDSTAIGAVEPVTIQRPQIARVDFGARVAIGERDTLVCSWIDSNGERSVVLVRAHAGRREPVQPRIAPEIIEPGEDTKQVIARSEAEPHALAKMDHPSIAAELGVALEAPGFLTAALERAAAEPLRVLALLAWREFLTANADYRFFTQTARYVWRNDPPIGSRISARSADRAPNPARKPRSRRRHGGCVSSSPRSVSRSRGGRP